MSNKVAITIDLNKPIAALKMKAIAKHFNALAEELLFIQHKRCPECGSVIKAHRWSRHERHVYCACPDCAYSGFRKAEYFVCDTDWRSEKVGVAWNARENRPVDHAK